MNNQQGKRYSDADLEMFQTLIQTKLERATAQWEELSSQIIEITEGSGDDYGGDWIDDSSMHHDVEMLNNMAARQRRYIYDLEKALVRIKNKTYGICSVTGELIDQRRLMAVPTTTKSIEAKHAMQLREQQQAPEDSRPEEAYPEMTESEEEMG